MSVLRVLFLVVLAACSSTPPPSQDPTPLAAVGVRPGDSLLVKVWGEPTYSGGASVDARGLVVLPILGEISVQGRTAESLTDSLKVIYRKYLNNPSIEIKVLRRISVEGRGGSSGTLPRRCHHHHRRSDLTGRRHHADWAIATRSCCGAAITVIVSALGPGTVLQNSPLQSGDQIFVPQRSWMSRNGQTFFVAALSVTTAVLVAVLVRR